jgi:hypothetical protein
MNALAAVVLSTLLSTAAIIAPPQFADTFAAVNGMIAENVVALLVPSPPSE